MLRMGLASYVYYYVQHVNNTLPRHKIIVCHSAPAKGHYMNAKSSRRQKIVNFAYGTPVICVVTYRQMCTHTKVR